MERSNAMLAVFLLAGILLLAGCTSSSANQNTAGGATVQNSTATGSNAVAGGSVAGAQAPTASGALKEFKTDSFYVMENGKPHPQYSLNEITVNKGDKVRILVTTINGTHDFNIDELNVHVMTPTGETTTVEFTADNAGEFVYYCSLPGHRANGHWGLLKVIG